MNTKMLNKSIILVFAIILMGLCTTWESCSKFPDISSLKTTDTILVADTVTIHDTITRIDTILVTDTINPRRNTFTLRLKKGLFSVGDTFDCALVGDIDNDILAAKFTIYFRKSLLTFVLANNPHPARNTLLVFTSQEQTTLTSINIQIGSPAFITGDTLAVLRFKTLNRTINDSIYFNRDFNLSTLRDANNQPVRIEHFESAVFSIN